MILKRIELVNYCQHAHRVVDVSGNMIAVVGHNGCLAEGTPVRMFDGTIKPVEQIKAGDVLLAFDDRTGRLTSSTVYDMIRTEPNHKPKPMLEVEINGEKTCTTYDHPFFAGDGFYPLYQLAWGALEAGERARLKLLCEQYGASFDDSTVWQQSSSRDEARPRPTWVLQDRDGWAYREGTPDCGRELAGEPAWSSVHQPYRLQSYKQPGGEPGVVHTEVQCVVWGNPWKYHGTETGDTVKGGTHTGNSRVGGEAEKVPEKDSRGFGETDSRGGGPDSSTCHTSDDSEEHRTASLRINVMEAAPYYTIRMREAPYTYCIGRRNCYLTHNCGKSNFLGALQFALTGEQPGKNKADLLHWGAKEGRVLLDFEQDGKPGRIERAINGTKVTLEYDGETVSGITNVAKALEDRLHVDKDLVRQSVFVRQKEVDLIISAKTDKRERETAFQKLLGIDAAKIHKNLTDWMYGATKPVNYDIQITDAEQRLGQLEARIADLNGQVTAAQAKLDAAGKPDDSGSEQTRKAIATLTSLLDAQGTCHVTKEAELKAAADLQAAQNAVADAGDNPGLDIATKAQEIAVLTEEARKCTDYAARKGAVAAAQATFDLITAKTCPSEAQIASAATGAQKLAERVMTVRHERDVRSKALGSLSGGETLCPVCGKPLDADMVARLTAERNALSAELAKLEPEAAAARTSETALRTVKAKIDREIVMAKANLDTANNALAACPVPMLEAATVKAELEKAKCELLLQKEFDSKVAGRKTALSEAEIRLQVAEKAVKDAETLLGDTERIVESLYGKEAVADPKAARANFEAVVAAAEKRRQEVQALQVELTRVTATRDEALQSKSVLEGTVATLKAQQAEQDALAKRLKVIEKVRDWFSYQNGPRLLVQQVMGALTDDVNRFLGNFTAPFVVPPDQEQLGCRVQVTDGRDRPDEPPGTDVLSGGEMVQLAVAFRLAIYTMFAGKLGLLSLDEPTAYLDEGNVDRFGILLGKVRDIARNMNTRGLMATHERAVIPHMDSVIDLN